MVQRPVTMASLTPMITLPQRTAMLTALGKQVIAATISSKMVSLVMMATLPTVIIAPPTARRLRRFAAMALPRELSLAMTAATIPMIGLWRGIAMQPAQAQQAIAETAPRSKKKPAMLGMLEPISIPQVKSAISPAMGMRPSAGMETPQTAKLATAPH